MKQTFQKQQMEQNDICSDHTENERIQIWKLVRLRKTPPHVQHIKMISNSFLQFQLSSYCLRSINCYLYRGKNLLHQYKIRYYEKNATPVILHSGTGNWHFLTSQKIDPLIQQLYLFYNIYPDVSG